MSNRRAIAVLAGAQFLMVLDQSVMNVSISQLVADFDTTVTTIQAVITFYSLVMAALMITGAKLGDVIGRRRAFTIGLVVFSVVGQFIKMYFEYTATMKVHEAERAAAMQSQPRYKTDGRTADGRTADGRTADGQAA